VGYLAGTSQSCLEVDHQNERSLLLTMKDLIMGAAVAETMGEGAKKKLAKRRLEAMGGNVASYSRVLNLTERMVAIKEAKALHVVVAEVSAEIETEKLMRAQNKESKKANGELKKKKKTVDALALKRKELMPKLLNLCRWRDGACANPENRDPKGHTHIVSWRPRIKWTEQVRTEEQDCRELECDHISAILTRRTNRRELEAVEVDLLVLDSLSLTT
jgi:hypothetical protein